MNGELLNIIYGFYIGLFVNTNQSFSGTSAAIWYAITQEGNFFDVLHTTLNTSYDRVSYFFISYLLTLITFFILIVLLFKLFKWIFNLIFKLMRLN